MNKTEGILAREYLKRQELMKTPAGKIALESAQRIKQREVNREILEKYDPGYVPDSQILERKKTDEEIEMEQILKNFM